MHLLQGGFQKFLFAFPHHVTNPKARAPTSTSSSSSSTLPSLAGLDYPDLDSGFMVTPSPRWPLTPPSVEGLHLASPRLHLE